MNTRRTTTALLMAAAALALLACEGVAPEDGADGIPELGKTFASEHEAWTWVSERGRSLGLQDIRLDRNASGGLVGTSGAWVGAPAEVARAERRLLDEMGGRMGIVTIAGKGYPVRAADDAVEAVAKALVSCNGSLCTDDWSFKTSIGIYQTIGSRTRVTAGGSTPHSFEIKGSENWECVDPPGPLPYSCRKIGCNYPQSCPAGYQEQEGPGCTRTCTGTRWTATTSIHITLFEALPGTGFIVPSHTRFNTSTSSDLEVKFSQWGISGGEVSRAVGVCGVHSTTTELTSKGTATSWGIVLGCP